MTRYTHIEDVDDGDNLELLLHYDIHTRDRGIDANDTFACLSGSATVDSTGNARIIIWCDATTIRRN
jgi:hypothetical protein